MNTGHHLRDATDDDDETNVANILAELFPRPARAYRFEQCLSEKYYTMASSHTGSTAFEEILSRRRSLLQLQGTWTEIGRGQQSVRRKEGRKEGSCPTHCPFLPPHYGRERDWLPTEVRVVRPSVRPSVRPASIEKHCLERAVMQLGKCAL
jgi:hypothetical protein